MPDDDATGRPGLCRLLRWWPALFALWLLFVGEWTWLVAIWGAGLSLVAAASAVAVGRHGLLDLRGRWAWAPELASAGLAVVVDFGILTRELATAIVRRRREVGVFLHDSSTAGTGRLASGRRAWVTLVATWSPNCYVVDIDRKSGRRLIHDLRPHRSSETPV